MHPITRREKLKKDLTDLNYFAKKVIFVGNHCVGKVASKSPDRFCLIERQRVIDWKRIDFMLELAEA